MSTEWIKPLEWKNEGAEPSETLKNDGFKPDYKPAADTFNYFLHREQECIEQIQEEIDEISGKTDKVDNTPDSEKMVKFASEAGHARKVDNALTLRINGGDNEGTDKWTFDGSTSRSVNLTPKKLGISADDVSESDKKKFAINVEALSLDGVDYTATVEGITELYNGMEITIIPTMNNATRNPTLNVNGLGAIKIYRPLSFATFVANAPEENFIRAYTPCRLMYHAEYVNGGIWLIAEKQKTSAQDLYGTVPVSSGGTGHNSVDTTPTENSTKMVTSGGVFAAIKGLKPLLYWESVSIVGTYTETNKKIVGIYFNHLCETPFNDAQLTISLDTFKAKFLELVPKQFKLIATGFVGGTPLNCIYHDGTYIYVVGQVLNDSGLAESYKLDDLTISNLDGVTHRYIVLGDG